MTKPIKPSEVGKRKLAAIPDEVFEAFNELITENIKGRYASVGQDKVKARILAKMPNETSDSLFEKKWLDVEDHYRAVGWDVEYDKPSYSENFFKFTRPMRGV